MFGDKGFAAATVEDIARAAGVVKWTVYIYFPSQAEIYRAAFARNIGELGQRAVPPPPPTAPSSPASSAWGAAVPTGP